MPRNEYRSNLKMLAMGNVVALFLGASTGSATPVAINDCGGEYVGRTMSQIAMSCHEHRTDDYSRFRYNYNAHDHFIWCTTHTPELRAFENLARQNDLVRELNWCTKDIRPKNFPNCVEYAWWAMAEQDVAHELRGWWRGQYGFPWVPCDFSRLQPRARWDSSWREHFDYCGAHGGSMAPATNEDFERRKAIASCIDVPSEHPHP